jgi:hypothetical protein
MAAQTAAAQLAKCRDRRAGAELRVDRAGLSTDPADVAAWLATVHVTTKLEPALAADLAAAERAVTDAETALAEARQRLAELERRAALPEKVAQAQAELAALRG